VELYTHAPYTFPVRAVTTLAFSCTSTILDYISLPYWSYQKKKCCLKVYEQLLWCAIPWPLSDVNSIFEVPTKIEAFCKKEPQSERRHTPPGLLDLAVLAKTGYGTMKPT